MKSHKILVVDDDPQNLHLMRVVLEDEFSLVYATNGKKAIQAAEKHTPDLILMDVMMPEMDGYEACSKINRTQSLSKIPVIFVTAMADVQDEVEGFEAGGVDFITKPVKPAVLRRRIHTHLSLVHTRELERSRLMIIQKLGRAAEFKDNETGRHVIRMSNYSRLISEEMGYPENWCELLMLAAPMHDLGKIGVPDRILLKPGPLDENEWRIMRRHPKIGADIIGQHDSELLGLAAEIAFSHHEKFDGTGYPRRLAGERIPMSGRIIAVADVFDALVTSRPYKDAWPVDKAVDLIREESGRHFDPEVVKAFLGGKDAVLSIREKWPENE